MADLFNERGEKIEGAMTPEEIETRLGEERDTIIEETNSARQSEIDEIANQLKEKETKLTEAEEALTKAGEKDRNLGGQRKVIEEKEKVINDLKTSIDGLQKKVGDMETSLTTKEKNSLIDKMVDTEADGNQNLKEKILFQYRKFSPIDETNKTPEQVQAEIADRIKSAVILAGGGQGIPMSGRIISSAGGIPTIDSNPTGEKMNPDTKNVADGLGISDAELKRNRLI
jgi:DNA repair exonuclease SbcCD ATPase subunit